MSILLITLFSFLAAMSLIVILFILPMAVQDSPQARIKRRLTAIGRLDYASKAEIQSLLKTSVYSEVPWLNQLFSKLQFMRRIDLLVRARQCGHDAGSFSALLYWRRKRHLLADIFCGIFHAALLYFCFNCAFLSLRLSADDYLETTEKVSRTVPRRTRHDQPKPSGWHGAHAIDGLCRQRDAGSAGHGILSLH